MDKVRCIHVTEENSGELPSVYKMDDPETPQLFFDQVMENVELGELVTVKLVDLTQDEWLQAVKIGKIESGELDLDDI